MGSRPLISTASAFRPVFIQTRSSTNTLRRKTTAAVEQQIPHLLHLEKRNICNTIRRKGGRSIGSGIWSDEVLHAAIEVVDNGTLIAHAATTVNIPASSLHDHLFWKDYKEETRTTNNIHKSRGRGTARLLAQNAKVRTSFVTFAIKVLSYTHNTNQVYSFQRQHPQLNGFETSTPILLCKNLKALKQQE